MKFPPKPILYAALRTLYVAAYTTRNWTTKSQNEIPTEKINDLWEALHQIPDLLTSWGESYSEKKCEQELVMYLKEYCEKWDDPYIKQTFVQAYEKALSDE